MINDVKLFLTVYRILEFSAANCWRYPIRRQVTKTSALEDSFLLRSSLYIKIKQGLL